MPRRSRKRPEPAPGEYLTLRGYARHRAGRGLRGKTHQAVSKAIKDGRLVEGVHETEHGLRIDPEVADREWAEGTSTQRQHKPAGGRPVAGAELGPGAGLFEDVPEPAADEGRSAANRRALQSANAAKAVYGARLAKLELEQRSGRLVPRVQVEAGAFGAFRRLRDRLGQVPDRTAPLVVAEARKHAEQAEHHVRVLLEHEIDEALAAIAAELESLAPELEAAR